MGRYCITKGMQADSCFENLFKPQWDLVCGYDGGGAFPGLSCGLHMD